MEMGNITLEHELSSIIGLCMYLSVYLPISLSDVYFLNLKNFSTMDVSYLVYYQNIWQKKWKWTKEEMIYLQKDLV